ncbi:MAG: response regulator [Candidatus Bathyarchaeia archaeon]|jgi:DNA-binding NtrC family response regulator
MTSNPPILLVENNEREAQLLKRILEGESFNVDVVYSGWAALEWIKDRKYASAIVDFVLPDMKGDELADRIKLEYPGMRVILLTGFLKAIDARKLDKFKYVFEKPADPRKIIEAMREITRDFK